MVATILTNAAETNRAVLYYIPEVTWGTTPASGVVKTMRITSSSLAAKKTTKLSDEIRADRMVSSVIETAAMTDGDINWELSAGGQDDFLAQFMLSSWSKTMNFMLVKGASVSVVTTSKIRLAGHDWSLWLANNQYVKLEGFVSPFNNGYFKVASFAFTGGNTDITTVETTLIVEAGTSLSKLMDANDLLLKSTTATLTSGNKITKTGWTTGLGLQAGQKLYLEGLGKETGSIAVNPALPTNNQTFTIGDSVDTLTFEFATALALASSGNVFVQINVDPSVTADNINAAVMTQFNKQNFRVSSKKVAGVKETGSVAFSGVAAVGDIYTIDDGRVGATAFTAIAGTSGAVAPQWNIGVSATDSAANLGAAVATILRLASAPVAGTVTFTNNNYTGGSIVETTDSGTVGTVTNFSGGTKPSVTLTNGRAAGGAIVEALASIVGTNFSGGDAAKNGFVTIASVPDADNVVVVETLTADANGGGLTVIVKGSHVRNPSSAASLVKQSISAETGFTDVGKYLANNGLRVGSFKKTINPGDIIKGSFSFMGRQTTARDSTNLGNTSLYSVLEATNEEVLNGTANVGEVLRNGAALTTAILKIDINGDSSLREQKAVGAKFPAGIGYGRMVIKGSFSAYFQNFDLYRDFLNNTTASLAWTVEDADHNKYYYTLPAIKYLTDAPTPDGIDKDVTEDISFTAFRDPVLGTQIMLDRFSSVWPATVA